MGRPCICCEKPSSSSSSSSSISSSFVSSSSSVSSASSSSSVSSASSVSSVSSASSASSQSVSSQSVSSQSVSSQSVSSESVSSESASSISVSSESASSASVSSESASSVSSQSVSSESASSVSSQSVSSASSESASSVSSQSVSSASSASESVSASSVSDSVSASSVSTSSSCPHCSRCLMIGFGPTGTKFPSTQPPNGCGTSTHGIALIHQDFGGTSDCGLNGINYSLYGTSSQGGDPTVDDNQTHLSYDPPSVTTPSSCYGEHLWLFEEHGAATGGNWSVGNQITGCAWNGMILSPDEKAFWDLTTCCEVVWVTTNDPATAVVVPETDPSALYMASKITNTWSLWIVTAAGCCYGTFPPKPVDNPAGNFVPATIPNCGITGGAATANSFTASALHIACSQNRDTSDPDASQKFLTVTFDRDDTYCGADDTQRCLVSDWVVDYYWGPTAGSNWCPAASSFPQGQLYGQGGNSFSPNLIYGSCEEIPCAYIGDGNGNWLPFLTCPNIEGKICVCKPHPSKPSEYAGQMYVTSCGETK